MSKLQWIVCCPSLQQCGNMMASSIQLTCSRSDSEKDPYMDYEHFPFSFEDAKKKWKLEADENSVSSASSVNSSPFASPEKKNPSPPPQREFSDVRVCLSIEFTQFVCRELKRVSHTGAVDVDHEVANLQTFFKKCEAQLVVHGGAAVAAIVISLTSLPELVARNEEDVTKWMTKHLPEESCEVVRGAFSERSLLQLLDEKAHWGHVDMYAWEAPGDCGAEYSYSSEGVSAAIKIMKRRPLRCLN